VSKRHPGLLVKFGGHAMAAGLTVRAKDFDTFVSAFEEVGEWLTDDQLARVIETDGDIEDACFSPEFVTLLEGQVWGQGFRRRRSAASSTYCARPCSRAST
jgi:single-stranded-DNA-specific exonuclease